MEFAESRYATTSDPVRVAYQVFGGPNELAFVQEHEMKGHPGTEPHRRSVAGMKPDVHYVRNGGVAPPIS